MRPPSGQHTTTASLPNTLGRAGVANEDSFVQRERCAKTQRQSMRTNKPLQSQRLALPTVQIKDRLNKTVCDGNAKERTGFRQDANHQTRATQISLIHKIEASRSTRKPNDTVVTFPCSIRPSSLCNLPPPFQVHTVVRPVGFHAHIISRLLQPPPDPAVLSERPAKNGTSWPSPASLEASFSHLSMPTASSLLFPPTPPPSCTEKGATTVPHAHASVQYVQTALALGRNSSDLRPLVETNMA